MSENEHFVFRRDTFRFVLGEHFVLRIINAKASARRTSDGTATHAFSFLSLNQLRSYQLSCPGKLQDLNWKVSSGATFYL